MRGGVRSGTVEANPRAKRENLRQPKQPQPLHPPQRRPLESPACLPLQLSLDLPPPQPGPSAEKPPTGRTVIIIDLD